MTDRQKNTSSLGATGRRRHAPKNKMVTFTLGSVLLYTSVSVPVPIEQATPQRPEPTKCQQPGPPDYPICADPRRKR